MTGLRRPPPRSKKESSAAGSFLTAGPIVVDLESDGDGDAVQKVSDGEVSLSAAEGDAAVTEAKDVARQHRLDANQAARRGRDGARAAVPATRRAQGAQKSQRAQKAQKSQEAKSGRSARAKDVEDHIVEAPREPKKPLLERLRGRSENKSPKNATADNTKDDSPGKARRAGRTSTGGVAKVVHVLAGLLGAVGLACSVVLAVGAFFVARGTDDSNDLFRTLSQVCDVLVGPLSDALSFAGSNANMKEALVAWGLGSLAYLVVGLVAQSFLRSNVDE